MAVTNNNVPTDLRRYEVKLASITAERHKTLVKELPVYETVRLFLEALPHDVEREGVKVVQVLKVIIEQAAKATQTMSGQEAADAMNVIEDTFREGERT